MSDSTPSTLTSPLSSLFSESFSPGGQSGSEIVTSDEEPDLGAFTTILRAWGYLQPQPRIPLQFSSLTSSSTRGTTPTTITGYPGFGDANFETVEGSTIWDHFPINSYLRASNANSTATSSGRTERARPLLLEEPEDDDYVSSPPPSPASESAQTVEITSEADATSIRSATDDDGEGMLEPRATPSNEGRTVLVAGSQDEQMSPPAAPPASSPSHLSVISGISVSSSSVSNQILDDNTPIFRSRPAPSTLSLDSYRPQISTLRTPSSVFQETPSSAFPSIVPFQETPTSSSPAVLPGQRRPFTGRMISNSSHAESDIINSYYNRETMAVSPPSSTDQPARDFLWPRLEIPAQPRSSPTEPRHLEISDHAHHCQTPSVIDDNSSASAVTEEPPPSSNTMSSALFNQREIATPRSDSPGTLSSHSMTPSHSMIFPGAPTSALSPTTTTTSRSTTTTNSTMAPSMESSMVYNTQYPPFPSGHRDRQPRSDFFDDTQATPSRQHHHLLSPKGDPCHGQPSLGFLDAALQFMAAERARLNALIENESRRSPTLSIREKDREEMVGHRENEKKYAIEYQRNSQFKSSFATTESLSTHNEASSTNSTSHRPQTLSSRDNFSSTNESVVLANSANTTPKKVHKKRNAKSTSSTASNEVKPITILKRPGGLVNTNISTSSSNLLNDHSHNSHSQPVTHTNASISTQVHVTAAVGSTKSRNDGATTPRAHTYLYTFSSDNQGSIDDEEGDDEDEGAEEEEAESRGPGSDSYPNHGGNNGHLYIDKYGRRVRKSKEANHIEGLYKSTHGLGGGRVDSSMEDEDEDTEDEEAEAGNKLICGDDQGKTVIADISSSGKKKEKKKKKAKKRKLPVTLPSKSCSVPDLHAEVGVIDSSPEENVNSSSSGLVKKSTIPSSSSFPGSQKKKGNLRFAESSLLDPEFSNNLATSGWPIGKGEFVRNKRARLVALAQLLQKLFPGENEFLENVVGKLRDHSPPDTAGTSIKEGKKKKKGTRAISLDDSLLDYGSLANSDIPKISGEEDPDPRGDPPGKKDTLVHVFIDHSNILIGFLNHLKRKPKHLSSPFKSAVAYSAQIVAGSASAASRPLPIPKTKGGITIPDSKFSILLPSFATANLSHSLFSTSLAKRNTTTGSRNVRDVNSDGDGYVQSGNDGDDDEDEDDNEVPPVPGFENEGRGVKVIEEKKKKTKSRETKVHLLWHMWHAALAMILERGRPISRRVVAASKPLYQSMETIERLGYEVKVFQRVPDLGDGADRLEKMKDKGIHNGSPTKGNPSPSKASHKTHVHPSSGDTGAAVVSSNSGPQLGTTTRVKYREQGVDELLQLKLHLAITAPDDVPEGATIILATGDGNVGQFNEDGFLGAVRTALKRGWKVELYAWECCLSRSWQREFGPGSEWGKRGMFRIITLDPFAECLVELAE